MDKLFVNTFHCKYVKQVKNTQYLGDKKKNF